MFFLFFLFSLSHRRDALEAREHYPNSGPDDGSTGWGPYITFPSVLSGNVGGRAGAFDLCQLGRALIWQGWR